MIHAIHAIHAVHNRDKEIKIADRNNNKGDHNQEIAIPIANRNKVKEILTADYNKIVDHNRVIVILIVGRNKVKEILTADHSNKGLRDHVRHNNNKGLKILQHRNQKTNKY
jgi:hypothetical protein